MPSKQRLKWRKKLLLKFPDRIELYKDVWKHYKQRHEDAGIDSVAHSMNLSGRSVREIVGEINADPEIKQLVEGE